MKKTVLFEQFGFTLLEMILAIAILSTVSTLGYLGLIQFNKSKDLGIATSDFVNMLNEAKTDTQTQVNATTCGTTNTFIGYQVTLDTSVSPNKYKLELVCDNAFTLPSPAVCAGGYCITTVKTKTFPTSVSISLNKVEQNSQIADVCHNTKLTSASSILFKTPNGILTSSYSANLSNAEGVGVDANGTILQCDANCNVSLPCPASPTPIPTP